MKIAPKLPGFRKIRRGPGTFFAEIPTTAEPNHHLSPPFPPPLQRRLQSPPAKSKFLALMSILLWAFLVGLASAHLNDHFADATILSQNSEVKINVSPFGSTRQILEPAHSGNSSDGSLWWQWTSPATGTLTVETIGAIVGQKIALYQGSSVNALRSLDIDPGGIQIEEGETVLIAAAGWRDFQFTLSLVPPPPPSSPPNDNFQDREMIEPWAGTSYSYEGSTLRATMEAGEPAPADGSDQRRSIWLEWTAPRSGFFSVRINSGIDEFAFYQGDTLAFLEQRLLENNQPGVSIEKGETLIIQFIDVTSGEGSVARVRLDFLPTEKNDRSWRAADLGSAFPLNVTTDLEGTDQLNDDGTVSQVKTGWWRWLAPANGVLEIRLESSALSFDEGFYTLQAGTLSSLAVVDEVVRQGFSIAEVHENDEIFFKMTERSDYLNSAFRPFAST